MSDVKTMVFPEMGSNSGLETALLANGGMGGMNGPFWAFLLLAYLSRNGGFGGYGDNNCQLSQIQATLNTNQGQSLLMSAIKDNNGAVHELATTLNCNTNAIQSAISAIQSAIANVGSQVGYNAMQTINAINSGNAGLANQLASCCCDVKQLVTTQGYEGRINNLQQSQLIQNGFAQVGYAAAENTCALKQNANDNTNRVIAKLDAIEDSRKDREIAALTAQVATLTARAERKDDLAPVYQALNDIKCKQPTTYNVPYQPFTAVPNCVAYQAFGLNPYGYGYNSGQWS